MKILFYIVRHGETDYNIQGRLQGQLDLPLNQNGINVGILTGKALCDVKFDRVISSPLKRAYQTAQILLRENRASSAEIETDDRLKEFSFGTWEGLGCVAGNREVPDEYLEFFRDGMAFRGAPEGESTKQVLARTAAFLHEAANDPVNDGKTVLVSTHGAAMRALLHPAYEDDSDFWHGGVPANCAVNVLLAENGELTLLRDDAIYYDRSMSHNPYNE